MTGTGNEPDPAGPATDAIPAPAAQPVTVHDNRALIATVIVCTVLLMACVGSAGGYYLLLRTGSDTPSTPVSEASRAPLLSTPGSSPTASGGPEAGGEFGQQGMEPSEYPAEKADDLKRVCDDNIFYPQSPKYAGKAPHPVVLLAQDSPQRMRIQDQGYYYDLGISKSVEQTWAASDDVRKVQLVACLDFVRAGAKIRTCKFDDPAPASVPLMRATWRLRVYELATGRKLLEKTMDGDDRACPYVALIFGDRKLYAEASDRAKIAALRNLVTRNR